MEYGETRTTFDKRPIASPIVNARLGLVALLSPVLVGCASLSAPPYDFPVVAQDGVNLATAECAASRESHSGATSGTTLRGSARHEAAHVRGTTEGKPRFAPGPGTYLQSSQCRGRGFESRPRYPIKTR